MSTTNEVRQILMNELGLSRDSIRGEMESIIKDCVARHWQALIDQKGLDGIIKMIVEDRLNHLRHCEADNAALREELKAHARAWREWSEDAPSDRARRIMLDNAESIEKMLQPNEQGKG